MRVDKRKHDQIREISIEPNILKHAEGSCLIKFGNTHVICAATIDESVPRFLKGQKKGWVTAEYNMLPRATIQRTQRDVNSFKPKGRNLEIQRLISRSMRAAVDLNLMNEIQIIIDCDVVNADGGTRTAAITGSYIALHLAIRELINKKRLNKNPLISQISAISCGICKGQLLVDLDYVEDSEADVDANFVFNQKGHLIEIQGTGEKSDFTTDQLIEMTRAAQKATSQLFIVQNKILLG